MIVKYGAISESSKELEGPIECQVRDERLIYLKTRLIVYRTYKECKKDWWLWADALPMGIQVILDDTTLSLSSLQSMPCKDLCTEKLEKYLIACQNSSGISHILISR